MDDHSLSSNRFGARTTYCQTDGGVRKASLPPPSSAPPQSLRLDRVLQKILFWRTMYSESDAPNDGSVSIPLRMLSFFEAHPTLKIKTAAESISNNLDNLVHNIIIIEISYCKSLASPYHENLLVCARFFPQKIGGVTGLPETFSTFPVKELGVDFFFTIDRLIPYGSRKELYKKVSPSLPDMFARDELRFIGANDPRKDTAWFKKNSQLAVMSFPGDDVTKRRIVHLLSVAAAVSRQWPVYTAMQHSCYFLTNAVWEAFKRHAGAREEWNPLLAYLRCRYPPKSMKKALRAGEKVQDPLFLALVEEIIAKCVVRPGRLVDMHGTSQLPSPFPTGIQDASHKPSLLRSIMGGPNLLGGKKPSSDGQDESSDSDAHSREAESANRSQNHPWTSSNNRSLPASIATSDRIITHWDGDADSSNALTSNDSVISGAPAPGPSGALVPSTSVVLKGKETADVHDPNQLAISILLDQLKRGRCVLDSATRSALLEALGNDTPTLD